MLKQKSKRLLCLLLSLTVVLIFSAVSLSVFADETEEDTSTETTTTYVATVTVTSTSDSVETKSYESLGDALSAANSETDAKSITVTLLEDLTYSDSGSKLAINTAIPFILEMNGHSITFESTSSYVQIGTSCTDVTIQDSSESDSKSKIQNTSETKTGAYILYAYGGSMTTSITVKNVDLYSKSFYAIYYYTSDKATLTLENCDVSSGATYAINGLRGNITVTSGSVGSVCAVLKTTSGNTTYSYAYTFGTDGGSVNDLTVGTLYIKTAGDDLTIKSGTFDTISGTINDGSKISSSAAFKDVSGCNLPAGYTWKASETVEGAYCITELTESDAAAKIVSSDGTTIALYDSLANATKAATSGQTVVLLKDYESDTYVQTQYAGVTIDLNGHNITNTSTTTTYGAVRAYADSITDSDNAIITIKNSSTTQSTITGVTNAVVGATKSTLTDGVELVIDTTNLTLTTEGGDGSSPVALNYYCYLDDTETNEALITNGGFVANAGDNDTRIYGAFPYAVNSSTVSGSTVEVKLLNDYYGSTSISSASVKTSATTVKLDMGGNTWTTTTYGTGTSSPGKVINLSDNRSYEISNGNFIATGKYVCGVYIYNSSTCTANLTLTGVDITLSNSTAYYFGMVTNGSTGNEHTIVLDGSTIDASYCDYGVYFPSAGSLTLKNNSKIIGKYTGIEIRSGDLTVTDSTVQTTDSSYFSTSNNNSGSTVTGAAIAVSQHTTDNEITVTIENSEISGYYGIYEINYNGESNTNTVSISVSGEETAVTGTGADAIYSVSVSGPNNDDVEAVTNDNAKIEVTSGTYSSDVSEYTTDESAAVATTDEEGNTTYKVVETGDNVAAVVDASGNVTTYATLTAAINKVQSGETVTLLCDVGEAIGVAVGKDFTLDLNGCTLTKTDSGRPITLRGGSLTITDSGTDGAVTTSVGDSAIYNAGGTVTVNGGTISATNSSPAIVNNWQSSNYAEYPSTVVVNGGKVTASGAPALRNNAAGCKITVNGGEVIGYSGSTGYYIVDSASAADSQSIIVTGGYFTTNETSANQGLFYQGNTGNIVISGGYFNNAISWINSAMRASGYSNTTLSGDDVVTYNGVDYAYTVASATVMYGTISTDEDGNETIGYVGGGTTPQQAVNEIKKMELSDGVSGYIELAADVNTACDVSANTAMNVVLELNGYNISTDSDNAAIVAQANVNLTVRDSVGGSEVSSGYSNGTIRNRGGVLTIEGGTYTNTSGCVLQNNGSDEATDSTYLTYITGGKFNGTFSINKGSLSITGGTYTSNPTTYVATGYAVYESTDESGATIYSVSPLVLGGSSVSTTSVNATSIVNMGTNTIYVGVSADDISKFSKDNYPTTDLTYTGGTNDSGKYIFAGWYKGSDGTYTAMETFPKSNDDTTGATTYYAKFVDANVLSVQLIGTEGKEDDGDANANYWRFFTSVDSFNYDAVGFKVTNDSTTDDLTGKVYSKYTVQSADNTTVYKSDFSSASQYVVTNLYTDSDGDIKSLTVQAYWKTLDGTTVYGESETFTTDNFYSAATTTATSVDLTSVEL